MRTWDHHIVGLTDILATYDDTNFVEVKDAAVAHLKAQVIWAEDPPEDPFAETYWYIVDEMADATNEQHFDACLNGLFDWGDDNSVAIR
jgi:hypothetical protein